MRGGGERRSRGAHLPQMREVVLARELCGHHAAERSRRAGAPARVYPSTHHFIDLRTRLSAAGGSLTEMNFFYKK